MTNYIIKRDGARNLQGGSLVDAKKRTERLLAKSMKRGWSGKWEKVSTGVYAYRLLNSNGRLQSGGAVLNRSDLAAKPPVKRTAASQRASKQFANAVRRTSAKPVVKKRIKARKSKPVAAPLVVKGVIAKDSAGDLVVQAHWSGGAVRIDRPHTASWGVNSNSQRLASRMVKAIDDGVVYDDIEVRMDVNGKTYVSATSKVRAKHMNANLRRLGY